ncbi:hypothetical protein [Hymenobacter terricola]|uniref:hypothetical protein n=1 Tax=Hymenobacter terricola TaxID=2819236 RepID=UPI001B302330|nr:hypothetical protein [Hymenobacter terricola]
MKTIRFSLIVSGFGDAIATVLWYDGATLCHYYGTDIHIDTLSPGEYFVTVAAHLLEGSQLTVLVDDITDIKKPQNLFRQFSDRVITNISQPYEVNEQDEA